MLKKLLGIFLSKVKQNTVLGDLILGWAYGLLCYDGSDAEVLKLKHNINEVNLRSNRTGNVGKTKCESMAIRGLLC